MHNHILIPSNKQNRISNKYLMKRDKANITKNQITFRANKLFADFKGNLNKLYIYHQTKSFSILLNMKNIVILHQSQTSGPLQICMLYSNNFCSLYLFLNSLICQTFTILSPKYTKKVLYKIKQKCVHLNQIISALQNTKKARACSKLHTIFFFSIIF